jgi:hypothetical protein
MQSIAANFVHLVVNYKDTTDNVHITVEKSVGSYETIWNHLL